MKLYQHTFTVCSLVLIALITGFSACSSMHDPYEEFIEEGEIIYPGMPDSVLMQPGYNRVLLSWPMPADPTITTAKISWHNGRESVEVTMDSIRVGDEARVMLNDMEEGSYTFTIHHYDSEGNTSIDMTTTGRVYGDTYANSLLPRIVDEALFAGGELTIEWGSADEAAFANEISYTDLSGSEKTIYAPGEEENTLISDYDFAAGNTIRYRTMYRPDSMAVDTFYTSYIETRVYGPRVEYSKTEWTATASSYDARPVHGDKRMPFRAIDEDTGTSWINAVGETEFPHWIKIDMAAVNNIDGISFNVQNRAETPQTIEIRVSDDDVNWTLMGIFNLERITTKQNIDFPETLDIRYIEVTATESYGSANIVIDEIGAYTR